MLAVFSIKNFSIKQFCFQLYVGLFFRTHLCSVDCWSVPQREIICILSEAFDQPEVFPLEHHMDPETMGIWIHIIPKTFRVSSSTFTIQC